MVVCVCVYTRACHATFIILFLSLNQQCQSTDSKQSTDTNKWPGPSLFYPNVVSSVNHHAGRVTVRPPVNTVLCSQVVCRSHWCTELTIGQVYSAFIKKTSWLKPRFFAQNLKSSENLETVTTVNMWCTSSFLGDVVCDSVLTVA